MVKLVGILNVTPDSFSDGGKFIDPAAAITKADQLFKDGAALIDVGAESTRPNATPLTSTEEWARLEPVLKVLLIKYPGRISLDSYHPETIKRAFDIGPVIVNDVTGFNNPKMVDTVADLKPLVIISHLPKMSIQEAHKLTPVSTVEQVKKDLLTKVQTLKNHGLSSNQIILDPGIGFGKTMELNKQLLKFAEQVPDYKVMIGYSRKRFLGDNRMDLVPNIEAGKIAAAHGAAYLRVHDVAGHTELLCQHN
jgi:dihydropteroate synthase